MKKQSALFSNKPADQKGFVEPCDDVTIIDQWFSLRAIMIEDGRVCILMDVSMEQFLKKFKLIRE